MEKTNRDSKDNKYDKFVFESNGTTYIAMDLLMEHSSVNRDEIQRIVEEGSKDSKDISNFGLNVKKFHSREYNTAKFRDINKKILLLIMIILFTSILMVRWNIISLLSVNCVIRL
jgi:hypothetical protein